MRRWFLAVSLLLIAFVVGCVTGFTTYVPLLSEPSPRNPGPGGLTNFVHVLESYGHRVLEPKNLGEAVNELRSYDPREELLIVTGITENDLRFVNDLLSWVRSGGELLVMDELRDVEPLLKYVGVSLGSVPIVGIAKAECLGNKTVVLDVYTAVRGGEALCRVGETPVAIFKRLGAGVVIVVGDSSLAINMLRSYPAIYSENTAFLLDIVGKRSIVAIYYPASREVEKLRAYRFLNVVNGVTEFISRACTSTPLSASLTTLFVAMIVALSTTSRLRLFRGGGGEAERLLQEARNELSRALSRLKEPGVSDGVGEG